jgi:carbohydrate binding protein with CBM11 domain
MKEKFKGSTLSRCFSPQWGTAITFVVMALIFFPTLAKTAPVKIIFLHHSVGEGLINEGSVREKLTALGYAFYDHGYNEEGLRNANGSHTGRNFNVPGDNTNPDGFANIFGQGLTNPPTNTFSHLMQYDVILFKSCYPVSNIESADDLNRYKAHYRSIINRMDSYPNKTFIIVTQPPLVPNETDTNAARRAREFANWLKSDSFLAGHKNVFVFDFFGRLAGSDNMLKAGYRQDRYDSHPNSRANREIGPVFVNFIDRIIKSRGAIVSTPTPTETMEETLATDKTAAIEIKTETKPEIVTDIAPERSPATSSMIDDFETKSTNWETSTDGGKSTVEFGFDNGKSKNGNRSLKISYNLKKDGYGDCGRYFDNVKNWSAYGGFSMWIYSEKGGEEITLNLFSGDSSDPTPFDVFFTTTRGWKLYSFSWARFKKAEWASGGGLTKINPKRMTGYGLGLGDYNKSIKGTIWIDDIGLVSK